MVKDRDEVFRDLFKRYYQRTFAFFLYKGFPHEHAQDLTQETFFRVYRGRRRYRGLAEWSYIREVAKNVLSNDLRYASAKKRIDEKKTVTINNSEEDGPQAQLSSKEPSPESHLVRKEIIALCEKEIEALPARMRQCFLMSIQGSRYRDIAVAMQTSENSVKKLVYRARRQVREEVARKIKGRDPDIGPREEEVKGEG